MTPDKLREKGNRWRELGQYDLANIYNQHAAALEELATMRPFFIKHALGPKAKPSCLCCGRNDYDAVAVQHGELPGIVICDRCKSAAALEEVERLKGERDDALTAAKAEASGADKWRQTAHEAERDLQFVERWANHHGVKPNIAAEEVLSMIQHYPPIRAITEGYEDGKIPDTPNPWDRAEKAERRAERLQAQVDALMLEYCPDEMTPEQLAEWEKHQRAVPAEFKGE